MIKIHKNAARKSLNKSERILTAQILIQEKSIRSIINTINICNDIEELMRLNIKLRDEAMHATQLLSELKQIKELKKESKIFIIEF